MSRLLLLSLTLSASIACAGPIQPMAAPTLSALPDDPQERTNALDSAAARRGPEHMAKPSKRLRQVETAAATAAGILGILFSESANVCIGAGAPIDENLIGDPLEALAPKRPEAALEIELETDAQPLPVFGPTLED
jgi:hypothetical protein